MSASPVETTTKRVIIWVAIQFPRMGCECNEGNCVYPACKANSPMMREVPQSFDGCSYIEDGVAYTCSSATCEKYGCQH